MSKIHKFSGYVVEHNDIENLKEMLEDLLVNCLEGTPQQLHVLSEDIPDIDKEIHLTEENCDLAELEKWFIKEPTKGRKERPVEIGATYRHFKGHEVKVLAVAKDTEYTNSYSVVYEHLGSGVVWSRPYDMFTSEVDNEKYPEVTQKYRFEKVGE